MPHFRLNLYNAHGDLPDPEGADFATLDEARRAAIEGIRSVLGAEVIEGELNMKGHLDIVADDDSVVETIPFGEALKIVGPGQG